MSSSNAHPDLHVRVEDLEKKNKLLNDGLRQSGRLQALWAQSVEELKATKEKLRASKEFLSHVLTTTPLPIVVLNRLGRIVLANAAMEGLMCMPRDELVGKRMLNLLYQYDRRDALRWFRAGWNDGYQAGRHEFLLRTPDGATRLLDVEWARFSEDRVDHAQVILLGQDITERRKAEENLRLAAKIIETSPQGIIVLSADGHVVDVNSAFQGISGYDKQEILGEHLHRLVSPDAVESFQQRVWSQVGERGLCQGEVWFQQKFGNIYPVWLAIHRLESDDGEVTHYIVLFTDISERKKVEDRLEFLSFHDHLTSLPNRLLFRERLDNALVHAKRREQMVGILYLDLDGFKHINDNLGHDTGDQLLQSVAGRLKEHLRDGDTVARLGGDEFAVILTDMDSHHGVEVVARKILDAVSKPFVLGGETFFVTTSIGISLYPKDDTDIDGLMKHADIAMYKAKEQGKNAYQLYTSDMDAQAARRMTLQNQMQIALHQGQFVVFYQPQISVSTGRLVGAEALVRWQHPEFGLMAPLQFIPLAEETGFIVPLGNEVIRLACEQMTEWHDQGFPDLRLAINLSARQLRTDSLLDVVGDVLTTTGMDPRCIELELTESAVMQNVQMTEQILEALQGLGISFALDDFGTGYSSMAHLKRFPITRLKIAQQFLRDVWNDPYNSAISEAIINMGHSLGLRVLAEGVETKEQVRFLASRGCDEAQGMYYSRPLAADAFLEALHGQ